MKTSRVHPTFSALRPPEATQRAERAVAATPENKDWFRIENKDDESSSADIYIYDEIGFWGTSASSFIRQLKDLEVDAITLHLNSPGGEVFDGTAIYNTLVNHPATVTVIVDGLAASAASFIAQAGDEIIMGQGSMMMIHDASGMAWGNAEDVRGLADILDKVSNNIASIYSANAGGTAAEWRELMKMEVWYTAEEAAAVGLATKVGAKAKKADSAKNSFDLTPFNYAGRDEAPDPIQLREQVRNRVKEMSMSASAVKPRVGNQTEEPVTDPAVEPEQELVEVTPEPASEDAPPPPVSESEPDGEAAEQTEQVAPQQVGTPEAEPVPAQTDPATQQVEPANIANRAPEGGFIINGVRVTDPEAIQRHIASLEGFQNEINSGARRDFVATLASDGKIIASQVEDMTAHVASLSPEQYKAFSDMWANAPKLPLLGQHVGGGGMDNAAGSRDAERIATIEDTIKHLRNAGKSQEWIEASALYAELQVLQSRQS